MVHGTVIDMTTERFLHCPDCAADRLFTPVECLDGHGAECPELVCTSCDAAVLLAPVPAPARPARRTLREAA